MYKLMYVHACPCNHIQVHVYTCVCVHICVLNCFYVSFVCMNMILFASQIIICLLCAARNVQRGSVHKNLTSASTFFHSISDIKNQANYNALLPFLDLL